VLYHLYFLRRERREMVPIGKGLRRKRKRKERKGGCFFLPYHLL